MRPHIFSAAGVADSKFTTTSDRVWMVTNCTFGKEIDKTYYEKCTGLDTDDYFNSVGPVTVNNVTYSNKFCAYCNGVDESLPMRHWDIEIHCSGSISPTDNDIYDQIVESNCSLYFRIPDNYKQKCNIPEYKISVCNTTGLWPVYHKATELACQSFVDPFNGTYQNYFCYVCNTDQPKTPANWNCPHLGDQTAEITPPFIALISLDAVQQWREDKQLDCNIVNQFKDKKKVIMLILPIELLQKSIIFLPFILKFRLLISKFRYLKISTHLLEIFDLVSQNFEITRNFDLVFGQSFVY